MRKKPTHLYLAECIKFTDHGAVMERYAGITNNPLRRITEHLEGRGAKFLKGKALHRVATLYVSNKIYGVSNNNIDEIKIPNIWQLEKQVKRLKPEIKKAIIDAAFGECKHDASDKYPTYLWSIFWRPYWKQCSRQCQRYYAKIKGRKVAIATISLGKGGGSDCSECGGTGGIFHELDDCIDSHSLFFCDVNCSEWETCKRPYRNLNRDIDDYCDDLVEVDD